MQAFAANNPTPIQTAPPVSLSLYDLAYVQALSEKLGVFLDSKSTSLRNIFLDCALNEPK